VNHILVESAIQTMHGRRVFGERSRSLRHLWLVPAAGWRGTGQHILFRAERSVCGWKQGRSTREAQGKVTSASTVLREVEAEAEGEPHAWIGAAIGATVAKIDACKALGYCVTCVRRLAPMCGHDDCAAHPDLALACMVSSGNPP
jgi:hypothetical protein